MVIRSKTKNLNSENKKKLRELVGQYLLNQDPVDFYEIQRILEPNVDKTYQLKYWLNRENILEEDVDNFVQDWEKEIERITTHYKKYNVLLATPLEIKGSRRTEAVQKDLLKNLFLRNDSLLSEIYYYRDLNNNRFRDMPFPNSVNLEKCIFFESKEISALDHEHAFD